MNNKLKSKEQSFWKKLCLTYILFSGVVWVSAAVTVMTASVTQDAFMAPANSPGSVTARRDGVDSSATRVRSHNALVHFWDYFRWSPFWIRDKLSTKSRVTKCSIFTF